MKSTQTIEALVQQIALTCLQITGQGRHLAFFGYSAHVGVFSVRVLPASTLYVEGRPQHAVLTRGVRLRRPDALAELESLHDNLQLLHSREAA